MINVSELVARCENLSRASNKSLSTISGYLFGEGTRLNALKSGKDMGARRIEATMPKLIQLEEQYAAELAALVDDPAQQPQVN